MVTGGLERYVALNVRVFLRNNLAAGSHLRMLPESPRRKKTDALYTLNSIYRLQELCRLSYDL